MAPRRSARNHASSKAPHPTPTPSARVSKPTKAKTSRVSKPAKVARPGKPAKASAAKASRPSKPAPPAKPPASTPKSTDSASSAVKESTFTLPHSPKPLACARHALPSQSAAPATLIFTHGASGSLSDDAMAIFARGYATVSPVVLFESLGGVPRRADAMTAVATHEGATVVGGRSMGARAACRAAAEARVLVSFPLVGGNGSDRGEELMGLEGDVLFVSGGKDEMCPLAKLEGVRREMGARTWRVVVEGANHGMACGKGTEAMREATGRIAGEWVAGRDEGRREMVISWDGEKVAGDEWREG